MVILKILFLINPLISLSHQSFFFFFLFQNAIFYQNRSLLNNAKELAKNKDTTELQALSNHEVSLLDVILVFGFSFNVNKLFIFFNVIVVFGFSVFVSLTAMVMFLVFVKIR